MTPFLYGLAAYLVFQLAMGVFVATTASMAHRYSIAVKEMAIGFGPCIFRKQLGTSQFQFRLIPLGGFVSFHGEDEDEDLDRDLEWQTDEGESPQPMDSECFSEIKWTRFNEAPLMARFLVAVSGPISQILIGALFLALPVWFGGRQLMVSSPQQGLIRPSGVPGLCSATARLHGSRKDNYVEIQPLNTHFAWLHFNRWKTGVARSPFLSPAR